MSQADFRAPRSALLAGYAHDDVHYHEMLDVDGGVRPHWQRLLEELDQLGTPALRHRHDVIARQIREDGITYNVYADAKGADRPWSLDLLPNILPAAEWNALAAGVAQRAALLDGVLRDVYGAQTLLRDGLLPPDLVFGHENFLWPCHGIVPPGGRFLHLHAVDLARAPNGRWWVVADRTQAPSGAGYALENRQIVSRAFPELLRELKVQQLGGFFDALLATLRRDAPVDEGQSPLIVLMTPGRFNETYFEHVFLARHLGVPLVEGQDLTVRGDDVFLKTLGGLRRVHAILRRLDDDYCDPLELRGDSALGVSGLLDVARRGRVLIANALGSGVLESPGLAGFLPAICERLRGESLLLPSVASWWCGEAPVCADASRQLERLVVKGAFPSQRFPPMFGPALSRNRLDELRARIAAQPRAYVAQEFVQLSQAPVWQRQGARARIVPRAIGMRVYAVATEQGYTVMPGGLTRVAGRSATGIVSMQRGGTSKDTWVLSDAAHDEDAPQQRRIRARDIVRRDDFLPSRLVENLFWTGRYCERIDDTARLLRVVLTRYADSSGNDPAFEAALDVCRALGMLRGKTPIRQRLLAAVADPQTDCSLADALARLYWSASQVRGRLSQENWRTLAELQRETAARVPGVLDVGDALAVIDRVLGASSALAGFAHEDMTRDEGWRFLMLARRLERLQFLGDVIARVLRHPAATEPGTLTWLLELADSIITYRARYLSAPQVIPTLDLVMCDPANPHALAFQVGALRDDLREVSVPDVALQTLIDVEHRLRDCDLSVLEDALFGATGRSEALLGMARLAESVAVASRTLSDALTLRHFAHVDAIGQPTVSA
jgi:uncharacterized circularly permuted ATP-grasp superfamily protein/uncharacterized alpha-E superfamily protein